MVHSKISGEQCGGGERRWRAGFVGRRAGDGGACEGYKTRLSQPLRGKELGGVLISHRPSPGHGTRSESKIPIRSGRLQRLPAHAD